MQSMELTDKDDFGDGCHMASTKPFLNEVRITILKSGGIYGCG